MIDATPLFRLYARRRLRRIAAMDPVAEQRRQLFRLLKAAEDTRFGKDHEFAALGSVEDYQAAVPLRRYEDFHRDYWQGPFPHLRGTTWPRKIPYFAVTSGTTADVTKHIPVTREMVESNKRATLDLMAFHLRAKPDSRLFGGRNFMLGGSTAFRELAPGIRSGDLSGIAAAEIPFWARARSFPPLDVALIEDWEEKVEALAKTAARRDIRSIGGTPSWLLMLFERLAQERPDAGRNLAKIWPNLELLIHGGVNFAPYKRQFDAWLEGSRIDYREAYAASEGFVAGSDRSYGEGLRLNLDLGMFFEFVPVEELDAERPTRHWIENAECGVNYALVMTTCAGLWSWVLGDTVRLVDRNPPRLLVTGRTAYMLSAFGEHVIDEEFEEAVAAAADAIGDAVTDYSVGAVFPSPGAPQGRHRYVVEFAGGVPAREQADRFAETVDAKLKALNEDYAAHRAGDYQMAAPEILALPPGGFAEWMKRRGKLGGQNKVPRVITDPELFDRLCGFARERAGEASGGSA